MKKNLKLKLNRETLRFLETWQMAGVEGAATAQRTVCGTCGTCYWINTKCFP
jgi:hypothetical protein